MTGYPRPAADPPGPAGRPQPEHTGTSTVDQFGTFGRWVLALHQPKPRVLGHLPVCSCGSALVLCPYRTAATRYLGPPRTAS